LGAAGAWSVPIYGHFLRACFWGLVYGNWNFGIIQWGAEQDMMFYWVQIGVDEQFWGCK
jgi:hypothetical protein